MKIFKTLIFILIAVFLVLIFSYNRSINRTDNNGIEKQFVIENGQGLGTIARGLKGAELIHSKTYFKVYSVLSGRQGSFRSGDYNLSSKMNIKEIVAELTKPVFLKAEEKITFIEGWNIENYNEAILKSNLENKADFLKQSQKNYSEEFSFLKDKPKNKSLEGYLFPDTYRFYVDIKSDDMIKKMLSNFDKKLSEQMRADISAQGKTIFEIVTMASVIEKEVRSANDMKIVSGIFWNRIKNGQALESCATLAYILGVNKSQYSYEDTRINSPYNTYINRGLPAGPIANPGLKAIEAAIYPEHTAYNYFLTASETGETIFSKTYQEHLNNKNKYIK